MLRRFSRTISHFSVLLTLMAAVSSLRAQAGDADRTMAPDMPAMSMGSGRMVRGTVVAVAGDRLTLKTDGGETFSVALTPNTRVMRDRQQARTSDIKVGDGIGAGGELDQPNKTIHALFVSVASAEEVRKIKEAYGKTWISGKVTSIDDLKITILRSDKVSQTIAVDEDTSFKRGGRGMALAMQGASSLPMGEGASRGSNGRTQKTEEGEPITLAEIKAGDVIAGQGALKGGIFVPVTLAVFDPAQHRHHQPGDPTSSSAAAPNAAASPQ